MDRALAGAMAGLAATAPMTAVMIRGHQELPWHDRYPIPPRLVTEDMLETLFSKVPGHESHRKAFTAAAHFGYGAAAGFGYGMLTKNSDLPYAALKGIGYGLAIWGISYLGWLPLMRMRAAAHRESDRRNAMMIASHIAWGLAAGLITEQLAAREGDRAGL